MFFSFHKIVFAFLVLGAFFFQPFAGVFEFSSPTSHMVYAQASWYDTDWQYRQKITIDSTQVDADLSNFQVYVDLSDMQAGFFTNVDANGADIRVTASDGTTETSREVVSIDTTSSTGDLHFKAPSLSSSADTDFYIYYGNPDASAPAEDSLYGAQNVWSEKETVSHLDDDPTGTTTDSTGNGNTAQSIGGMQSNDLVDADHGKALTFSEGGEGLNYGGQANNLRLNDMTLSIRFNSTQGQTLFAKSFSSTEDERYYILLSPSGSSQVRFDAGPSNDITFDGTPFLDGSWHIAHVVFDRDDTSSLYIDGVFIGSTDISGGENVDFDKDNNFYLAQYNDSSGNGTSGSLQYDGLLQEFRSEYKALSADWISTEASNQNSPSTFYTASAQEEVVINDAPTIQNVTDSPDPLQAGDPIEFRVDFTDANDDGVKTYVCKTDTFTAGSECDGAEWASESSAYSTTTPQTASYTTMSSDIGTNDYFVFVEDEKQGVSTSTSGTFTVEDPNPNVAWYDDGWRYRQKITIDSTQVDAPLIDFPVYVDLSDLQSEFFSRVQDTGADVRVTEADGSTELPREVVSIDRANSTGEMHFKSEYLSSSNDTDFYIYYGNQNATAPAPNDTYGSQNVWTNGYALVSHDGATNDATANGNSAAVFGNLTPGGATGQLGSGTVYDGVDDYTNYGDSQSLNITGDTITVSAWIDYQHNGYWSIVSRNAFDGSHAAPFFYYYLGVFQNYDSRFDVTRGADDDRQTAFGNRLTTNTRYHLTGTYDGSSVSIYENGIKESGQSFNGNLGSGAHTWIGANEGGEYAQGMIDEVRIASIARSADWNAAEYSNQNAPTNFYTASAEEVENNAPNTPTNQVPTDNATGVSVVPTFESSDFSDPDAGDTHSSSQWQVTATSSDYATPVYDSGATTTALTTLTVPRGTLENGTEYFWHVRYTDQLGATSSYSSETSFTTQAPAVSVTESGGSTDVTEGGANDSYDIVLETQPENDVEISVSTDDQATTSVSTLIFTSENWDTAQSVTVDAVDDAVEEGNHTSVITQSASSSDADYDGITVDDVTVNITDDDTAGVSITESDGTTEISEAGQDDSYEMVLTSKPVADVNVTLDTDNEASTTPTSLTFTSVNWDTPQTITVSAVDDASVEGEHVSTTTHSVSSADASYDGVSVRSVTASITDDDIPGVSFILSGDSTVVSEDGATDTYDIVLNTPPAAPVTVNVSTSSELTLSATTTSFTTTNWDTPQTITVSAVDDDEDESDENVVLTHSASSSDEDYDIANAGSVNVSVVSNDETSSSGGGSGGSGSNVSTSDDDDERSADDDGRDEQDEANENTDNERAESDEVVETERESEDEFNVFAPRDGQTYASNQSVVFSGSAPAESSVVIAFDGKIREVPVSQFGFWATKINETLTPGAYTVAISLFENEGESVETVSRSFVVNEPSVTAPDTSSPFFEENRPDVSVDNPLPELPFFPDDDNETRENGGDSSEEESSQERVVPEDAPPVFSGVWDIFNTDQFNKFVFEPLPESMNALAKAFPGVKQTFDDLGVTTLNDLARLESVSFNVGNAGVESGVLESESRADGRGAAESVPENTLLASSRDSGIDFTGQLSVSSTGDLVRAIRVPSRTPLALRVRPESEVQSITGYMSFTKSHYSNLPDEEKSISQTPERSFFAPSVARAQVPDGERNEKTELVTQKFTFSDEDGDGVYTADVVTPAVVGEYEVITVVNYADPSRENMQLRLKTVIDPEGYVYAQRDGGEIRIENAQVTLLEKATSTESYAPWNADAFSQNNPQTTDLTGEYSFLVPEGTYKLSVEASGYQAFESAPFDVQEGSGVHMNLELESEFRLWNWFNFTNILILVLVLLLGLNFYWDQRKRNKRT